MRTVGPLSNGKPIESAESTAWRLLGAEAWRLLSTGQLPAASQQAVALSCHRWQRACVAAILLNQGQLFTLQTQSFVNIPNSAKPLLLYRMHLHTMHSLLRVDRLPNSSAMTDQPSAHASRTVCASYCNLLRFSGTDQGKLGMPRCCQTCHEWCPGCSHWLRLKLMLEPSHGQHTIWPLQTVLQL